MDTKIVIPDIIRVGFQKRKDCYTGKLAYVIFIDHKGVVRKERSFEQWRDKKIPYIDIPNVPREGFTLNKKVGGTSNGWDHRLTYVRMWDPAGGGIEYEIQVPNLLWILTNCSSIKGKSIEGECVIGWAGTQLLVVPVDSPEYKEIQNYTKAVAAPTRKKGDMILGATYRTKSGLEVVYLGHRPTYNYDYTEAGDYGFRHQIGWKLRGKPVKKFLFHATNNGWRGIEAFSSLTPIIECIDENCHPDYAAMQDRVEMDSSYVLMDFDATNGTLHPAASAPFEQAAVLLDDTGKPLYYRTAEWVTGRNDRMMVVREVANSPYYGYGYRPQPALASFENQKQFMDWVAARPLYVKRKKLTNGKFVN